MWFVFFGTLCITLLHPTNVQQQHVVVFSVQLVLFLCKKNFVEITHMLAYKFFNACRNALFRSLILQKKYAYNVVFIPSRAFLSIFCRKITCPRPLVKTANMGHHGLFYAA